MSIEEQFLDLTNELHQHEAQFNQASQKLPIELQSLIDRNQNKLSRFLEAIQNEIISLKRAKERDCNSIERLKYQLEQKTTREELMAKVCQMESGLIQRLRYNLLGIEQACNELEANSIRNNERANRLQIEIENNRRNTGAPGLVNANSPIIIDKQNKRLIIKIKKSTMKVYQVWYNQRQDKFGIDLADKYVTQAVVEFNFHRNINKLYSELYSCS